MTNWNLAEIWETVAEVRPDHPAQRCGERTVTWQEFDRRANALAADLLDAGLGQQAKVAVELHNGPEYLEAYAAAFKGGLVPVNVNYRYGPTEVLYLLDNADAEAVVFHAGFSEVIDQIRARLPKVRRWYVVADGSPQPDWARSYEDTVSPGADRVSPPWGRSGDDLLLLYTGGTTGMPKGVMWRQDDLVNVLGSGGNPLLGLAPVADTAELRARIAGAQGSFSNLPACPLMHGTGQFSAFIAMIGGGCVVTMPDTRFDPAALWRTAERHEVNGISIVGDAFARPMLAELDAHPGAYDLSKVLVINSSGVMWSQEVKDGLLRHLPQVVLYDSLGSSEAVGMGASVAGMGLHAGTARFGLGEGARVIGDDDRDVTPGSGEVGVIALPGFLPVGYYQDPEKSAAHLPHDRRGALHHPRRLRHGGCGRDGALARAGVRRHQHRRREGVPGGSGGGHQAPPGGRRRGVRGRPRRPVRGAGRGAGGAGPGRAARTRPRWPTRSAPNWPPTRCPGWCAWWPPSGAARPARSTTRRWPASPPVRSGSGRRRPASAGRP